MELVQTYRAVGHGIKRRDAWSSLALYWKRWVEATESLERSAYGLGDLDTLTTNKLEDISPTSSSWLDSRITRTERILRPQYRAAKVLCIYGIIILVTSSFALSEGVVLLSPPRASRALSLSDLKVSIRASKQTTFGLGSSITCSV